MKSTFLFPAPIRKLGWLLFIPALLATLFLRIVQTETSTEIPLPVFAVASGEILSKPQFFTFIENDVTDEILMSMIIIGGILAGFSKLRHEDELTGRIRYESLVYAVYLNFAVMLAATLFIYGTYYFDVLLANVFTLLFFFLLRFQFKLHQLNKIPGDDQ